MRSLILTLFIITSCAIEGHDCEQATYSLSVWEAHSYGPVIHISYRSEINGYELSTACPEVYNTLPDAYIIIDRKENKNWAEWAITRECSPQYIRVRSLNGEIEKTISI
jgi:hypothetical protein